MLQENEALIAEIRKSYPNLQPYFIDLVISYCQDKTEQEISDMLESCVEKAKEKEETANDKTE
jgi:hypothetical protein